MKVQLQTKKLATVLALGYFSMTVAQKANLEPFTPASLPVTTMPKPVPPTMVTLPPGVTFGNGSCQPSVKGVLIPVLPISSFHYKAVSAKIQAIVNADQAARTSNVLGLDVAREDQKRREQLLPLIPLARTSEDFSEIALVFQHGNCLDHFLFANKMAQIAMQQVPQSSNLASPYAHAAWLSAATIDRALQVAGKPQKYGTQYFGLNGECPRLYVTDLKTTDAERQKLFVPTLEVAIKNAEELKFPNCK